MTFEANIQDLAMRVSTEAKSLRTLINGNQAGLAGLSTTAKSSLVAAINEIKAALGDITIDPATEAAAGIVELATPAEALAGVDTTRVVTPAGVKVVRDAIISQIMGDAPPALLDTFREIADALADDDTAIAALNTAIANRQPIDPTLTALAGLVVAADQLVYATGADTFATTALTTYARSLLGASTAGAARTTLDVYSKAEIGDVNADFVATFEAGLA